MPQDWEVGKWELLKDAQGKDIDSNVTAIHTSLLPEGKVLYFHARYAGHNANFCSSIYDPGNPTNIVQPNIPPWPDQANEVEPQNIFCSGHVQMEDGKTNYRFENKIKMDKSRFYKITQIRATSNYLFKKETK